MTTTKAKPKPAVKRPALAKKLIDKGMPEELAEKIANKGKPTKAKKKGK